MDPFTDSVFAGTQLRVMLQGQGMDIEKVWDATFNTAILKRLHPNLHTMIIATWIIALVNPLPSHWITVRKEELQWCYEGVRLGESPSSQLNENGRSGKGISLFGEELNNATISTMLAEGAGFGITAGTAMSDARAGIKTFTRSIGDSEKDNLALKKCADLGRMMALRVCLVYLGENCLQLYVQVATFLIHCFLSRSTEFLTENVFAQAPSNGYSHSPAGRQQLISLALSVLSVLAGLVDIKGY
jgi:hypothetical protein